MDKKDFNESLDSHLVVRGACSCNLKKNVALQNNMGRTVTFITCDICGKEWEITLELVEEESDE